MVPRADDGPILDVQPAPRVQSAPAPDRAADAPAAADLTPDQHAHDRWHWRRRIRAHPQRLFVYRILIGVLGLLCITAGLITGPLPGPGGIPLVLLGLAIWASEFRWAHRLMMWFKARLHQVRQLPPGRKVLFWAAFLACCGLIGYSSMLVFGLPSWLPAPVDRVLAYLPGLP